MNNTVLKIFTWISKDYNDYPFRFRVEILAWVAVVPVLFYLHDILD